MLRPSRDKIASGNASHGSELQVKTGRMSALHHITSCIVHLRQDLDSHLHIVLAGAPHQQNRLKASKHARSLSGFADGAQR